MYSSVARYFLFFFWGGEKGSYALCNYWTPVAVDASGAAVVAGAAAADREGGGGVAPVGRGERRGGTPEDALSPADGRVTADLDTCAVSR